MPPTRLSPETIATRVRVKKPNKTAQHILKVATQMFAEKGFDGTIMDELCERSGVNKASIYYHFGDKATLYDTALTDLFKRVADPILSAVAQRETPQQKLHTFIDMFARTASHTPAMPAVLMRELASGGIHMPVSAREQMQRLLFALKVILKSGYEQNLFKRTDPLTIQFMVIGTLCFFISSEPMRLAIPSQAKLDPNLDETIAELIRIIESALLLSPSTYNQT
ncbi:TetR/AcrR family transcriptional regulator [Thiomicrorhabdus chilensis]|uniref:TetR/AcrR family transcriptional regulator n=1 Tax=Thiomicrorhabdus chilensis TaxID=63656 RepID=UPI000406C3AA|nr:TetR/AcrR family transcriptional regulator [Thiomicrorhabdus chilensis]